MFKFLDAFKESKSKCSVYSFFYCIIYMSVFTCCIDLLIRFYIDYLRYSTVFQTYLNIHQEDRWITQVQCIL